MATAAARPPVRRVWQAPQQRAPPASSRRLPVLTCYPAACHKPPGLVAHHSCAIIEAGERGLTDVLSSEFDPAPDILASVLTCCDMTTSPDGQPVPVEKRLAEIHDRYGPGHLVSRSIRRATPMILEAVEQVHQRAAQAT